MRAFLAHVAFAIALLVLLQEGLARAVFPLPQVLNFDRSTYSHMGFAPGGHQPTSLGNASFRWESDPDGFEFVHTLNLYGFRDETWRRAKRAASTRVAFVGDSFVEGFSAADGDTIPHAFAERARELGLIVESLNLGVGGGSLKSHARLLRDALPLFLPDAVVLVLFANDVVASGIPEDWLAGALVPEPGSPWAPRLAYVLGRLRAGERVARRWIEPPFDFLPKVPDPRNPWSNGRHAGALVFVDAAIVRAARNGRFNPMLTEAMPWFEKMLRRSVDLTPWLRAFRNHASAQGADLSVVYLPSKMQVSDRYLPWIAQYSPPGSAVSLMGDAYQRHARELAAACTALGLPFLDLTPVFRQLESATALYWHYDDHLRPGGYRAAASAIFEWWRAYRPQ